MLFSSVFVFFFVFQQKQHLLFNDLGFSTQSAGGGRESRLGLGVEVLARNGRLEKQKRLKDTSEIKHILK